MTGGLSLLIVMAELDDDVVAWLNLLQYLIPTALIQETL